MVDNNALYDSDTYCFHIVGLILSDELVASKEKFIFACSWVLIDCCLMSP